jgi:hypothetical protein
MPEKNMAARSGYRTGSRRAGANQPRHGNRHGAGLHGAVIGGARLILTGVETGVRLATGSNEAGVYRFEAVDLGVYVLRVGVGPD